MMEVGVMKSILRYLEQLHSEVDQSEVVSYIHELLDEDEPGDDTSEPKNECGWQNIRHKELKVNQNNGASNEAVMNSLQCSISKSPLLAAYQLQPNELMLIARICQKTKANCEQDYSVPEICELLPGMDDNLDRQYSAVVDLIDREILSTPHLMGVDYHYDLRALYGTGLRLNGLLWNLILGKDPIKFGLKAFAKGLGKPDSAIDSILKMIGGLFMHYPELTDNFTSNNGACFGRNINLALDAFLDALITAKGASRWIELCKKHKLNAFWQKCLLLIDYFNRELSTQVSPATMASLLARNPKERKNYVDLLAKDNLLSCKCLIEPHHPMFAVYLMELTPIAL
ncbi:MAG TPA: hypothetical protein P5031_04790, partial [Candidatus Syntrophosphaera sp.]|nr:hypothetical protein [Candidatus Syntrophosphaera sp.]